MKPDYNDWRVWKEVSCEKYYFQMHEKYSQESINEVLSKLIESAHESGLEGCFFRFESNREPFENWLGNPSVEIVGYRKLTTQEVKEVQEESKKESIADKLGINLYELSILLALKEKGKIADFLKETDV